MEIKMSSNADGIGTTSITTIAATAIGTPKSVHLPGFTVDLIYYGATIVIAKSPSMRLSNLRHATEGT